MIYKYIHILSRVPGFQMHWYIPVYTKEQDFILGQDSGSTIRFTIHPGRVPCGSQCDVDFQGLSMHAYTPMKDTSFTAVKN